MTEPNDIPAILARADAAIAGPWIVGDDGNFGEVSVRTCHGFDIAEFTNRVEADFCVHSRTDVPNMAAEILSLRAQLTEREKNDNS